VTLHADPTISWSYLEQQRALHADPRGYGAKGDKWAPVVLALLQHFQAFSMLDYGCGQGSLARALRVAQPPEQQMRVRIAEYDPAIAGKDGSPSFADLVVCTDVLEHVEPIFLPSVLEHLRKLARKAVWLVVSTTETAKTLPDGRNAHLIVRDAIWWRDTVEAAGFTVQPPPAIASDRSDKEWIAVLLP
jgi:2-polyprenyl-3-methyl-5-hydroxy-6-metoxy-1,4-benzoquinol methylase